ncbi:MAG: hypothetical protein AAGF11_13050 [Myxococcota bacterium]
MLPPELLLADPLVLPVPRVDEESTADVPVVLVVEVVVSPALLSELDPSEAGESSPHATSDRALASKIGQRYDG